MLQAELDKERGSWNQELQRVSDLADTRAAEVMKLCQELAACQEQVKVGQQTM